MTATLPDTEQIDRVLDALDSTDRARLGLLSELDASNAVRRVVLAALGSVTRGYLAEHGILNNDTVASRLTPMGRQAAAGLVDAFGDEPGPDAEWSAEMEDVIDEVIEFEVAATEEAEATGTQATVSVVQI